MKNEWLWVIEMSLCKVKKDAEYIIRSCQSDYIMEFAKSVTQLFQNIPNEDSNWNIVGELVEKYGNDCEKTAWMLCRGQAAEWRLKMDENKIYVIRPYWLESVQTWVFDDGQFGIVQEPFVSGVPELINHLVINIDNAKDGFKLFFSDEAFPNYDMILSFNKKEYGGWWYVCNDMNGWLCAVAKYYFKHGPPNNIFIKAEALN